MGWDAGCLCEDSGFWLLHLLELGRQRTRLWPPRALANGEGALLPTRPTPPVVLKVNQLVHCEPWPKLPCSALHQCSPSFLLRLIARPDVDCKTIRLAYSNSGLIDRLASVARRHEMGSTHPALPALPAQAAMLLLPGQSTSELGTWAAWDHQPTQSLILSISKKLGIRLFQSLPASMSSLRCLVHPLQRP